MPGCKDAPRSTERPADPGPGASGLIRRRWKGQSGSFAGLNRALIEERPLLFLGAIGNGLGANRNEDLDLERGAGGVAHLVDRPTDP